MAKTKKVRSYLVYKHHDYQMRHPQWDAKRETDGYDALPPTVLAKPGIIVICAPTKKAAINELRVQERRCAL